MTRESRKLNWVHGRSAHRQRSDDDAHADASAASGPPVLAHPLVPQGEPNLINSQAALNTHLTELRRDGRFAYDTEFIGEHSYHPRLCVIQTATGDSVSIIDPLVPGLDLQELWRIITDPTVEKTVHAGEQDLEPAWRHTGRSPANIFDTQVVAAFTGWGYPTSMSRMIRDSLGADPGHGLTFSQWDRRPLSRVQTMYAANDVRYLPLLRDTLARKAADLGNLALALEECAMRSQGARYVFDAASQRLRVRGIESMNARETAVLTELLAWREQAAQVADLPPRALLRDGILAAIARDPPTRITDLDRISGLPRPVERKWGADIVAACERGRVAPLLKESPPVDRHALRDAVNRLWDRVSSLAATRQIDPTLLASKRELGAFLRATQAGLSIEDAAGNLLKGWRRAILRPLLTEA